MSTEANPPESPPSDINSVMSTEPIPVEDYRKYFRALLPTLMQEATHFTLDEYLLYKCLGQLDFIDCRLVFNCQAWSKLCCLTIRQPAGPTFLLELPPQLEELYVCDDRADFHVLSPWNRCRRFIHDRNNVWKPHLPYDVVCDEFLIRTTNCESLIDLFNLGYAYVKTVSYTPPKRFALFGGPSTPHTRRSRTMELFVRYSKSPPHTLPPLYYITVAKNTPLIKRCIKEMMRSWPENRDFYYDVYHLIQALNRIHSVARYDPNDIEKMEYEFREIDMDSDDGLKWQDRIGRHLTCYSCYNHQSSEEEDFDFSDTHVSESSESELDSSADELDECSRRNVYANDPIPGYEHFANPPPLYARYHKTL